MLTRLAVAVSCQHPALEPGGRNVAEFELFRADVNLNGADGRGMQEPAAAARIGRGDSL